MKYREAKTNTFNPPLTEEVQERFVHELAHLSIAAVRFNGGAVVEDPEGKEPSKTTFAMAYLMGWKWRQNLVIDILQKAGWPDPEFVDFVHDMAIRLGVVPYNPNELINRDEFEVAMKGKVSLTKAVRSGGFAFPAARQAYNAWCMAHNRPHTPHVQNQLEAHQEPGQSTTVQEKV